MGEESFDWLDDEIISWGRGGGGPFYWLVGIISWVGDRGIRYNINQQAE